MGSEKVLHIGKSAADLSLKKQGKTFFRSLILLNTLFSIYSR